MRWSILKQSQLPDAFISSAAGVLADTKTGLNRAEIVKQCTKYAVKYGVDIPVETTDWGDFGSKVKNKRTAMYDNLSAFSKEQQYAIINEKTMGRFLCLSLEPSHCLSCCKSSFDDLLLCYAFLFGAILTVFRTAPFVPF